MKKNSKTIGKISAAWNKKLWGFYKSPKLPPLNHKSIPDGLTPMKNVQVIENCAVHFNGFHFKAKAIVTQTR